ncbi:MAG: ATP-binding protein, partial [Thermodesulfovibrionales bacterium]
FPVWIRAALVKDSDGRPHSIIAVFRDLSERKRLEEELIQAQKLESLGTLAGGVAHDFNNIVNVINGFASLMRLEMDKDNPFCLYLDKIISAAERATHVTRQLLLFSRKHESEMRRLNINDIILNTEKLLVRFLPEDIRLRFIPSNKELMVMADIAQIDQLLMNLATNARDAMPAGGHMIISTSMTEIDDEFIRGRGFGEPGKYALLSVADTGTGMDEHTKKRAFDPFFTTKTTGTGLGLPVVYGIVRAHKGYIDLSSEPGQGSTFRIYIPLTEKGAEEQADAGRKTGQTMPQGNAETVLMAEDDPETRMLFSVVLEKLGYRVITAEDGADAVKKFLADRDAVNVLLLDVVMPNMNGREAYEEIRKIRPDIKAIFMSGYRGSFEKPLKIPEECDFLSKPVSPNDLAAKIREVLDRPPP